jgi:carboxymethylenebutenolidase
MHTSASGQKPARLLESTSSFQSANKKITVEIFTPVAKEKFAGILLFHGAGGIFMDGPAVRRVARALAQNGFETFVVHYFERTGNLYARDAAIQKNFDSWRATVNDAVDYLHARPEITGIGLFGYSLGGFLSLAQAAHDPRVGAVVELAGAIPKDHVALLKNLPPLLILHGAKDRRIPVESAYVLERIAQRLGIAYEMKIYENEGHVLSTTSQRDAAERAVHFFQKHLR